MVDDEHSPVGASGTAASFAGGSMIVVDASCADEASVVPASSPVAAVSVMALPFEAEQAASVARTTASALPEMRAVPVDRRHL